MFKNYIAVWNFHQCEWSLGNSLHSVNFTPMMNCTTGQSFSNGDWENGSKYFFSETTDLFSFMYGFVDRCLSICPFSFNHCVVCSSLIYGFWLPHWYLQTLLKPAQYINDQFMALTNVIIYMSTSNAILILIRKLSWNVPWMDM